MLGAGYELAFQALSLGAKYRALSKTCQEKLRIKPQNIWLRVSEMSTCSGAYAGAHNEHFGPNFAELNLRHDVCGNEDDRLCKSPGTRVPFQTLLDYFEAGDTIDAFLDDFPTVSREAAVEALELGKKLIVSRLE